MSVELQNFAREIHALGLETRRSLDASDVRYVKRLMHLSRAAEIAGRLLLQFGGGAWSWIGGTIGVAFHMCLDSQFMHAIHHGAYVGLPGAEKLTPETYETLAVPLQTKTWGQAHAIHHRSPSLVGTDPDTLHPFYRVHPALKWRFWHRLNVFLGPLVTFESCAVYYDRLLKQVGQRPKNDRGELYKFLGFVAYQYVFFPWMAGDRWLQVLAAGLVANFTRNLVVSGLQMGSSVGPGVSHRHDRAYGAKNPGEWCRFQVETSKNWKVDSYLGVRFWRALLGGLDRHIEHHLYPSLPPRRLHALSPRIQELCRRHSIEYEEHRSYVATLGDSLRYLHRLSRE